MNNNLGIYFKTIICDKKEICKTSDVFCRKCLRNRANILKDYFSLDGDIYGEPCSPKKDNKLIKILNRNNFRGDDK